MTHVPERRIKFDPRPGDWERFTNRVLVTESCWEWLGGKTGAGYGAAIVGGRTMMAHRVSYEFLIGHLDSTLVLDHLCRNTICVNPEHLEQVTVSENIRRAQQREFCKRGHALSGPNLYLGTSASGRYCKECHRIRQQEYVKRKAQAYAS